MVSLKRKTYLQAFSGQESSFVLYVFAQHQAQFGSWLMSRTQKSCNLLICPAPIEADGKIHPTFSSCEIIQPWCYDQILEERKKKSITQKRFFRKSPL